MGEEQLVSFNLSTFTRCQCETHQSLRLTDVKGRRTNPLSRHAGPPISSKRPGRCFLPQVSSRHQATPYAPDLHYTRSQRPATGTLPQTLPSHSHAPQTREPQKKNGVDDRTTDDPLPTARPGQQPSHMSEAQTPETPTTTPRSFEPPPPSPPTLFPDQRPSALHRHTYQRQQRARHRHQGHRSTRCRLLGHICFRQEHFCNQNPAAEAAPTADAAAADSANQTPSRADSRHRRTSCQ